MVQKIFPYEKSTSTIFFFNLIFSPSRLLEKNGSVYEKLMKLLVYPSGAEKSNVKFQEG